MYIEVNFIKRINRNLRRLRRESDFNSFIVCGCDILFKVGQQTLADLEKFFIVLECSDRLTLVITSFSFYQLIYRSNFPKMTKIFDKKLKKILDFFEMIVNNSSIYR